MILLCLMLISQNFHYLIFYTYTLISSCFDIITYFDRMDLSFYHLDILCNNLYSKCFYYFDNVNEHNYFNLFVAELKFYSYSYFYNLFRNFQIKNNFFLNRFYCFNYS